MVATQYPGGTTTPPTPTKPPQTAAPAPQTPSWYTATANIPGWENTNLNYLYQHNDLSGIPPEILAAIDQAESSGQGGAINSSGFGGYFGLGANSNYGGGWQDSAALLRGTTPAAFNTQAEMAAYEFAKLLQGTGGNIYAAETNYQGGSSEGTGIFSQQGIPGTLSGKYSPESAQQVGANGAAAGATAGLQAGNALSQEALSQQNVLGQAQQRIADTQLAQQLQDTMAALGLSGKTLGIQQLGLQQQYGQEKTQYGLSTQNIQEALANLAAQYGLTWQQFGLQGQQIGTQYSQGLRNLTQGDAASGTLGTATQRQGASDLATQRAQALQGLGIQEAQARQNYSYGLQGYQQQERQLAANWLYQQEQARNQWNQTGITAQQQALQKLEAQQQYQTGTQAAANQYADLVNSIVLQQGQNESNFASQMAQLVTQLQQAGMATGAVG